MDLSGYYNWLVLYIAGDRRKANAFLEANYNYIKFCALFLKRGLGVRKRTVHRGVLLDPDEPIKKHNMWAFDHVSFSDDIQVAKAFADINSQYGMFIKCIHPDYIGHLLKHNISDEDFIWFDHEWSKYFPQQLNEMVSYWNQKELIIGKGI